MVHSLLIVDLNKIFVKIRKRAGDIVAVSKNRSQFKCISRKKALYVSCERLLQHFNVIQEMIQASVELKQRANNTFGRRDGEERESYKIKSFNFNARDVSINNLMK